MNIYTQSNDLPYIIENIRRHNLEGALVCALDSKRNIRLFFHKGQLVEVQGDFGDRDVYKLLDILLKGYSFNVYWQPMPVSIAESNVSAEIYLTFLGVVELWTEEGRFQPPAQTQIKPDFFNSKNFRHSTISRLSSFSAY